MNDPTDPYDLSAAVTAQEDQVRAQMRDRMQGLQDLVETEVVSGGLDRLEATQYAFVLGAHAALHSFIDAVFQGKCHPDGINGAEEQVAAEKVLLQGLLDYLDHKEVSPPWVNRAAR